MAIIPFTPSSASSPPFIANVTLDGLPYQLFAIWNVYRVGWYIQIVSSGGQLTFTGPLVGSPSDFDIDLAPGIFSISTIVYREAEQQFVISP
ncbi:MAG: hypothetical protein ACYDBH_01050 [Acidobacteriaceae bacterium]